MKTDYEKLRKIERNGSRRAKVFCKRARKFGWSATSIVCALKFGFDHFRIK